MSADLKSGIYRGWIRHRRAGATAHAFRYRVFMMYLDLAELPALFEGVPFWSAWRPALAWFKRSDFLGDPAVSLLQSVADLVHERTGRRINGPVRLLTNLRYFGFQMNPVSFYYCFDRTGTTVEVIVAEVTNTPWGERHAYVLPVPDASDHWRFSFSKALHVSPFLPMEQRYNWNFKEPGERLTVHMDNLTRGQKVFDATLSLRRHEISGRALLITLLLYPLMTVKVALGIYSQALRLWCKGATFHSNPASGTEHVPVEHTR